MNARRSTRIRPRVYFINIFSSLLSYESSFLKFKFGFVTFWQKDTDEKSALKMLMKLTQNNVKIQKSKFSSMCIRELNRWNLARVVRFLAQANFWSFPSFFQKVSKMTKKLQTCINYKGSGWHTLFQPSSGPQSIWSKGSTKNTWEFSNPS